MHVRGRPTHCDCMCVCVCLQVNIYLPSLKVLRCICDRMKTLSKHIVLSANWEGELRLAVESDLVTVKTVVRDLDNPSHRECVCVSVFPLLLYIMLGMSWDSFVVTQIHMHIRTRFLLPM